MKSLPIDARKMVVLLYVAAAIVIVQELAEAAVFVFPAHFEVLSWRYGLLGTIVSRIATLAMADVMMLTAAVLLDHKRFLRAAGIVHLVIGILLIPLIGMYFLDALVMRRQIKPEFARAFDVNSARTAFMCGLSALAGGVVFWQTFRIRPSPPQETVEGKRSVLITDVSRQG